jgi:putative ABC transport system substrate-binding protein
MVADHQGRRHQDGVNLHAGSSAPGKLGRREFVALLGGSAAWPLAARAQQAGKLPTIGYLGAATSNAQSQWVAAFVRRLRELGWIEDRTVALEYRWAEGRNDRMAEIATEFVQLKVDVIVTSGTTAALALKQATTIIPIVFASAGDPVGNNIVASLARPGGNITGLSSQMTNTAAKRVELLREVIPGLRRLAILANIGAPNVVLELGEAQTAARSLGLEVAAIQVRRAEDIVEAFGTVSGRVDALDVIADPLMNANRVRINTLALAARLPTIFGPREAAEAGGLMSYGPSWVVRFRRAAEFVDKILRRTKPADIPVEQPTKFDLVINLTTAKALGLTVPDKLLALADQIIE